MTPDVSLLVRPQCQGPTVRPSATATAKTATASAIGAAAGAGPMLLPFMGMLAADEGPVAEILAGAGAAAPDADAAGAGAAAPVANAAGDGGARKKQRT